MSLRFEVGQKVVKVMEILGTRTASGPWEISEAGEGWVRIVCAPHLKYSCTSGREINPVIPNCNTYLIHYDGVV